MLTLSFSVNRSFESLDQFRADFSQKLRHLRLHDNESAQVELCVYEVIANIIEHESNGEEPTPVHVEIRFPSTSMIRCTLKWKAEAFDITRKKLPDLDDHFAKGKKDGLGIYIIHKLMDRLGYRHDGVFSTLELEKDLSAEIAITR